MTLSLTVIIGKQGGDNEERRDGGYLCTPVLSHSQLMGMEKGCLHCNCPSFTITPLIGIYCSIAYQGTLQLLIFHNCTTC